MVKLHTILEISSNIAIILLSIFIGYFLISRYVGELPNPTAAVGSTIKPGAKLTLSGVDLSKSDRNLLLVLSTSCRFCSESAPFYRRIIETNSKNRRLNIIASFPQELTEVRKYLNENGIGVDEVIKSNPSEVPVKGTPTIILMDRNGVVLETWAGKLMPEIEDEVARRIFSGAQVVTN